LSRLDIAEDWRSCSSIARAPGTNNKSPVKDEAFVSSCHQLSADADNDE
jgi:hypothetical protein